MFAIRGGSVDALAVLLNNGANPFSRNGLGQNALDISRTVDSQHQQMLSGCIEKAIE